jgi:hypothetical protein
VASKRPCAGAGRDIGLGSFGRTGAALLAGFLLAGAAEAQVEVRTNGGPIWESYSFDEGLVYEDLSEFSFPVVVDLRFGERTSLVLSSGYVSVQASATEGASAEDVSISGLLDTEARLTFEVLPRTLSLVVSGILPTGITEVATAQSSALGLIASEVLDFSMVRLGSGGGVGVGFVGAVPVGDLALGLGATFNASGEFAPVAGGPDYRPGTDLRIRAGLEGPVARATYLRVAGIYSLRGEDEVGGVSPGDPGGQFSLYGAVEQGLGSSTLGAYSFFSGRSEPSLGQTPVGLNVLPESRTFALGTFLAVPVRQRDVLTPRIEYRANSVVPLSEPGGDFETLGRGFRLGADYRFALQGTSDLVFHGDYFTGDVGDPVTPGMGELVGAGGYRIGLRLEWRTP